MADKTTRVAVAEIVIRDRTGAGAKSAITNFQQLHEVVRQNWWGIQNLGSAFSGVGALVAGGFAVGVKAAADFEAGMAGVARTTRGIGEDAADAVAGSKALGESLRDLAKTSPVELGRLTAIAQEAGALGIARQDITAFTKTIVELVATTNLTDESATKLARVANVMGLSAGEFGNLGSAILYAGRSTAATETEIVKFAQDLAPVIRSVNGTTAELIALSAVLPSLGQASGRTYSSIQRTISDISGALREGGEQAALFAKVMGVSQEEAARITSANGVKGLQLFTEGLARAKANGLDLDAVLASLGIKEQRQAVVLKAMSSNTKATAEAIRDVTRAYNENVELTEAYKVVTGTAQAQVAILKNEVHDLALSLGDSLLPFLKLVTGFLQDFVTGLDAIDPALKTAFAVIIVGGAALAGFLAVIALIGPKLVLVKGALIEASLAYRTFAGSAANAAAILATANNSTTGSTLRAAFSYGKLTAAERQAAFAAYQQANAQKIANAIQEQAIALNTVLTRAVALEAHAEESAVIAKAANTKATLSLIAANAAAAKGNVALAESHLAVFEAERAAAAAATQEIASTNAQIAALRTEIAVRQAAITKTIQQTEAEIALAGASTRGAVAVSLLGRATAAAKTKMGGIALILLTLIPLIAMHGAANEDSAKSASVNADYQLKVARALQQQKAGVKGAIDAMSFMQLKQIDGIAIAARYGFTLAQLNAIINGTSSNVDTAKFNSVINKAYSDGDKSAGALLKTVAQLRNSFKGQAAAAAASASANSASAGGMDKAAEAASKAKEALDELREANETINQALLALPQALLSQREAALAVADAQDAYRDALEASRHVAEAITKAENELTSAQLDRQKALRDIAKAEIALGRARQGALDDLADAEDAYASAQDKVIDANDKVLKAEQELEKLRNGPTMDDLNKATNKLADANLKLRDSQFKVRDAQYMLNYLMAEGASARDLEEAQYNLDSANQDVANSTQDLTDAQKELNDLTNPDPATIAAAERELEEARRDAAAAVRDQRDAEQELADQRASVANDEAYKDAEQDLAEARIAATEAAQAQREAEQALLDARANTGSTRALADAQLALEQALYRQAEANVEVQKQLAISRGEEFGTGREAKALAGELARLGLAASGPIRADFKKFSGILGGARRDIAKTDEALDSFGDGFDLEPVTSAFDDAEFDLTTPAEEAGKGFIGRMVDYFKENGVIALATGLIAMIVGAIVLVLGAPVWLAVLAAGLIAALVYWIVENKDKVKEAFQKVLDFFGDIGTWIKEKLDGIKDEVAEHWKSWAIAVVFGVPGAIFGYLWEKLNLSEFFKNLFGRDKATNDSQGKAHGKSLGQKLWDGFKEWLSSIFNPRNIIGGIFSRQRDASGQDGFSWGRFLGSLLFNGILSPFSGLGDALGRAIRGGLSMLPSWVTGPINAVIAIYNGFIEAIASKGFHIGAVKVLGQTVFPDFKMDFGFMRGLKVDPIKMAAGGITAGRQVGMIGEMGAEAVLPLDRLYEMLAPLDAIANQLLAVNDTSPQQISNVTHGDTFNIYSEDGDPLEIAEEIVWKKLVRT